MDEHDDNVGVSVNITVIDGKDCKEYYPVIALDFGENSNADLNWSLFDIACTTEKDAKDLALIFLTAMVDMPEKVYQALASQLKSGETRYANIH